MKFYVIDVIELMHFFWLKVGKSVKVGIFFGFLHLYRKKVDWIVDLNWVCWMGESVDFSRV